MKRRIRAAALALLLTAGLSACGKEESSISSAMGNRETSSQQTASEPVTSGTETASSDAGESSKEGSEPSAPEKETSHRETTKLNTSKASEPDEPDIDDPEPEDPQKPESPPNWQPEYYQNEILWEEGSLCGILYLGYDMSIGADDVYTAFDNVLTGSEYLDSFPFLSEVPETNYVDAGGQELYCILPRDDTEISVYDWIMDESNDYEGEARNLLYLSDVGAPILLRCSTMEGVPNCQISVTNPYVIEQKIVFEPCISGMDGHIYIPEDLNLVDFTLYQDWDSAY